VSSWQSLLPALTGKFGDRPDALRVGDESLSWEELSGWAQRTATELVGARMVAVPAVSSISTVVAVVAAIIAEVPIVPVPSDAGPIERDHQLRDSGAELVLTDSTRADFAADGWGVQTVDIASRRKSTLPGALTPTGHAGHARSPSDDRTALVLYTSGTTGPPKGVQITGGAIAAGLDGLADAWSWTPDDRLAHGLPLFHVHGLVLGVLGPLRIGAGLEHTVKPTPEAYAKAAERSATMFFGVPTVWGRIAAQTTAAAALAPARLLVSGSAALPVPVFQQLVAHTGHAPIERYGMTETLITLSTRADGPRLPGHVGSPIAGVQARVVDETGQTVQADGESIGDLEVRGATISAGYIGQPEAFAAQWTSDGWFKTGDVATVNPHGDHRLVGRKSSDLIKTGGYRVGAGEVESVLLAHPGIAEAAVIGVPDDDLGQAIVAFVVTPEGLDGGPSSVAIIDFVARELSVHKRPRRVHVVSELPRNAMGKVQKSRLQENK
jgi:fatty acid CoA ligase FadD36